MIVVAIIGILAAIAIPAFSRYVKKSRTAEASGHLNKMWAGATAYYIADHADSAGNLVEKQFPGPAAPDESTEQCGCQATQRCPGSSTAWGDPVWTSLSFGVRDPHNYMPHYSATGVGATATFTASATGDLDCDSTLSIFQRNGQIDSNHDVTGSGPVYVYNEVE